MTFRSRALLDLAHEIYHCQIRIPSCCTGYAPEGCEPVHGDHQWLGRGIGHKSADIFAAGCHACGAAMHTGQLSREEKGEFWTRGALRTWVFLMSNEWLRIAPRNQRTALQR